MGVGTCILTVLATAAALAAPLLIPTIREVMGRYIAGFIQHQFNERIEKLRSDLRQSETKFAAELRANEQQLKSLSDAALSLRSSRQSALDARRLQAVERLWESKIATDRMRITAQMVSGLDLDEMYKAAESGDRKIQLFAEMLDKLAGIDLRTVAPQASALSERPFITTKVWALFSAYQSVMLTSVMHIKILGTGTTKYMKKEDLLKPAMLVALPEYRDYIEKFGFAGYYHLLDVLEEKLLLTIAEMLDGQEFDQVTLKRNAEMMAAVRKLNAEQIPDIPESLRGPKIPDPPKV